MANPAMIGAQQLASGNGRPHGHERSNAFDFANLPSPIVKGKRPEHEQGNSSDSLDSFKEVGVSLAISRYSMRLSHEGAMVEIAL